MVNETLTILLLSQLRIYVILKIRMFQINSIRLRLQLAFLLITGIAVLVVGISNYTMYKRERVQEVTQSLDKLNVYYLQYIRAYNGFLSYETINPSFFETGISQYYITSKQYHDKIIHELKKLRYSRMISSFKMDSTLEQIEQKVEYGFSKFNDIIRLIRIRGFKDYGVEGVMRVNAHRLENMSFINQIDYLSLRRHEKDYIIRVDSTYIKDLNEVALKIQKDIVENQTYNPKSKEALDCLRGYLNQFNLLVALDQRLGLKKHGGLKEKLNNNEKALSELFDKSISQAEITQDELLYELRNYQIYISGFLIVLAVIISWWISRQITWPIVHLSSYMDRFVTNKFLNDEEFIITPSKDETGKLIVNFEILKKEILAHIYDLNQKVTERTAEVSLQKSLIERQNRIIGQQNKNMLDSIRYARHIQEAILPDSNYISSILPEYGLFYQPRDIVSGDFYFIDDYSDNRKDKVFIAVADSTGHGVPGAFMSLIGHNALSQAVNIKKMSDPVAILQHLDNSIHSTLHEKNRYSRINDGMDIGICVWDKKTNFIEFSGCNISLYLIRNGQLIEYSGQRYLIGHVFQDKNFPERSLTKKRIQVLQDDIICMSTDGYYDQFGGQDGGKMKRNRFKKLLESFNTMTLEEQNPKIKNYFESWKGSLDQTDDILVLWFKIL